MDWQVCVTKSCDMHYVNTHTDGLTDRKLKTEGPKITYKDIWHLQTAIIGSPEPEVNILMGFLLKYCSLFSVTEFRSHTVYLIITKSVLK